MERLLPIRDRLLVDRWVGAHRAGGPAPPGGCLVPPVQAGGDPVQLTLPVVLAELPPSLRELQQHLGRRVVVQLDDRAPLGQGEQWRDFDVAQAGERDRDDGHVPRERLRGHPQALVLGIGLADRLDPHRRPVRTHVRCLRAIPVRIPVLDSGHAPVHADLVFQHRQQCVGKHPAPTVDLPVGQLGVDRRELLEAVDERERHA